MQLLDHLGYGLVSVSSSPDAWREGPPERSTSLVIPGKVNFQHSRRSSKEKDQHIGKEWPVGAGPFPASSAGKNTVDQQDSVTF